MSRGTVLNRYLLDSVLGIEVTRLTAIKHIRSASARITCNWMASAVGATGSKYLGRPRRIRSHDYSGEKAEAMFGWSGMQNER